MNIIERQTELGRSLYEINTNTMSEMAELSRKNIETYLEVNRSFGEKLPEIREMTAFFDLQREYGETLWNNAREAIESQNAILQSAFSETRDAFKTAFTTEVTEAAEKVETAAKKTKKAASAS